MGRITGSKTESQTKTPPPPNCEVGEVGFGISSVTLISFLFSLIVTPSMGELGISQYLERREGNESPSPYKNYLTREFHLDFVDERNRKEEFCCSFFSEEDLDHSFPNIVVSHLPLPHTFLLANAPWYLGVKLPRST